MLKKEAKRYLPSIKDGLPQEFIVTSKTPIVDSNPNSTGGTHHIHDVSIKRTFRRKPKQS